MQKRILLLDTSFSAKPIYDYLVTTGAQVFVVGGNAQDALAKSLDNYINLDYSNVDKVKSLLSDLSIDYLVPGGNDFSYKVCAAINEEFSFFNIDSLEIYDIINNKETFRKFSASINLHVPRLVEMNQIPDSLPVIIKPVDAYSGHGMTVIYHDDKKKINEAINTAKEYSKSNRYLIEEFVQGQLFSHSAFIIDSEIFMDFVVEEHCIVNPYAVDTSHVLFDFSKEILNQLRKDITSLVKQLNLVDGLMHTQFICDGNSFWLIEVTRRCPGDLYSKLIELTTGFPYAEYYARPFLQNAKKNSNIELNTNLIMRHTITVDEPTAFNSISYKVPLNIVKYVPLSLSGDKLKESPFSRVGILFCEASSGDELQVLIENTKNRNLYSLN